jgi:hypothetical protein
MNQRRPSGTIYTNRYTEKGKYTMQLEPLKQWICDTCNELIARVEDGWLEWTHDDTGRHSFRIVHHKSASPLSKTTRDIGCYGAGANRDHHIERFLGALGEVNMLSLLDVGVLHAPNYRTQVSDIRSWSDMFRRLFCPYYEEARQYFAQVTNDGYLNGANEVHTYTQEFLRQMCVHYRYRNTSDE